MSSSRSSAANASPPAAAWISNSIGYLMNGMCACSTNDVIDETQDYYEKDYVNKSFYDSQDDGSICSSIKRCASMTTRAGSREQRDNYNHYNSNSINSNNYRSYSHDNVPRCGSPPISPSLSFATSATASMTTATTVTSSSTSSSSFDVDSTISTEIMANGGLSSLKNDPMFRNVERRARASYLATQQKHKRPQSSSKMIDYPQQYIRHESQNQQQHHHHHHHQVPRLVEL